MSATLDRNGRPENRLWQMPRGGLEHALREECGTDCTCRHAVVTAYRELTAHGYSDCEALRSCVLLYGIHHRDAPCGLASAQVRLWINAEVGRACGPRQRPAARRPARAA